MNQATLIFGAIMVAFVGFVAIKQRLGVYRNVVLGGASGGQQAAAGGSATAVPNSSPASAGGLHPTLPFVP